MRDVTYVLGHQPAEIRRLELQAQVLRPLTVQVLQDCGLGAGMSVLDIGSGAGDVALLAADMVGVSGSVVGIDRSDAVLERARARAKAAGLSQISFRTTDFKQNAAMGPFDLVVCRYVLIHQADHAEFLRRAAALVKKGGRLALVEMAAAADDLFSNPVSSPHDDGMRQLFDAFARAGADLSIGLSLVELFATASLPEPHLFSSAPVGGPASVIPEWLVRTMDSVSGSTMSEDEIASSTDRMRKAASSARALLFGPRNVGAWVRLG